MSGQQKRRKEAWIYSVFPVSVATGPLGTMVQLYLIYLNGQALGTIYGGLAAAVFNGISIPAALFWGYATDRLHKRKALIALSYALTAVALVSFFFDRTDHGDHIQVLGHLVRVSRFRDPAQPAGDGDRAEEQVGQRLR